ncbi:helix-turn-helix domain-containing protein [Hyphobacterium sp.]|uniref:helix-turn-helix domain-containing protein n=1 Tax=Hyphobacterium sp. TaxID=2004662 RepID=UPI003B521382
MRRFTRFPTDAMYDRRLTKTDVLILLAICMHLASKTDACWPSQATIAKFAQVGRQCVNRRIKHLIRTGWLRKQRRRRKSGMLGSCKYTVLEPVLPPQYRRGSAQISTKMFVASSATADVAQGATGVVASEATGKELDSENKIGRADNCRLNSGEERPESGGISIGKWKSARAAIRTEVGKRAYQEDLAKLTWKTGTIYAPSESIARRIWAAYGDRLERHGIQEIACV